VRLRTKFQVSSSTSFGDTLGCTPKIMGVTWPRPRPFSRFFFAGFWDIAAMRLRTEFQVYSSTRFGDTLGCTPKFMGVTWSRPRPFARFFFAGFWGIAAVRLCTKFEISSSTRFADMLTRANYRNTLFSPYQRPKPYCACAVARDLGVGVRNNRIFGIPDPDLSIHYTTLRGLRWRLRVVYLWASPL